MSPIDQLSQDLRTQFPDAKIETRKTDDPNGFQFLNRDLELLVIDEKDIER